MKLNFSFDDRIAKRYQAQRAHPQEVSVQIGAAISELLGSDKEVLEIGIGNGRIAMPAVAAGCRVTGMDLSAQMMAEIGESSNQLSLFQADMHHMPLQSGKFDGVLVVHVLHLANNWQRVLEEATRVLKRDGIILQGEDWTDPDSVFGLLRDQLRQIALDMMPGAKPPAAGVSKEAKLTELGGGTMEERVVAEWTSWLSPQERLNAIKNRMDNESWFLPDPVFNQIYPQLVDFAESHWKDLSKKEPVRRQFILKITAGEW